jgi:hypothetical protein
MDGDNIKKIQISIDSCLAGRPTAFPFFLLHLNISFFSAFAFIFAAALGVTPAIVVKFLAFSTPDANF